MPEYTSPGPTVEEIAAGPRPIEDVPTSSAGIAGETERGPVQPRLITNWTEYTSWYGGFVDCVVPPPSPNIYLPYSVRGFFENDGRRLYVARVAGPGSATAHGTLPGAGGDTTVEACGPGDWGNRVVVEVRNIEPEPERFAIQVFYFRDGVPAGGPRDRAPDAVEEFDGLAADSSLPNYAVTVVNAASRLIRIIDCPAAPAEALWPGLALQNGSSAAADAAAYDAGLSALGEIEEIGLMAVPDGTVIQTLGGALVDHCERRRDCFAVLSEPNDQPDIARVHPPRDSSYGAFYYPKLRVPAPHTPEGYLLVPPCGHVMGLIARVEMGRGIAKAPANEVVRGLLDADPLQFAITTNQQDSLNARSVNVIRDFRSSGRGVRVWGARTMSSDAQWRYINVRRLCIFLERSIRRGTQWAVSEPNAEPKWSAVRRSVESFLGMVWRDGALMGSRENDAFFVRCDRSTMTQDDLDNGRLVLLVGVAPVKATEFVILRISHGISTAAS